MQNFSGPVWVVGGSVRAAAGSAIRAGWQPVCTDFFADADLRKIAHVDPVANYPAGLLELAEKLPPMPWIYTGGLENNPDLVAEISQRHTLWGNDADPLRRARDPFLLADILNDAGLPALTVRRDPPTDGNRWLRKSLYSSGGCGIQDWRGDSTQSSQQATARNYFQGLAHGEPISAVFLAGPGTTQLLEITLQLIGLQKAYAPAFRWCGNIAPLPVPMATREAIDRIGKAVADKCSLRGLFGCDFMLNDNIPWLTEVNPRYTGSVELIEHLQQCSLLEEHRRACTFSESIAHSNQQGRAQRPKFAGKLILYTDHDGIAADATRFILQHPSLGRLPFVADIPVPGLRLEPGQPLCTVYATGRSQAECHVKLIRRAELIRERLVQSTG